MLDHIGFGVADYARSRVFYVKVLAPLGYGVVMDITKEMTGGYEGTGFGLPGKPDFWIGTGQPLQPCLHIAFAAKTRAEVDAFYRAAIEAGAKDNGAPGLRPHYHPNYYGAFVFDPDGHNIEAVCHLPE
ncbi:MAG: VOC family protein [Proteobacteria bacterium]|nr:VOC family protein [Pseudomonadota bacterium]